MFTQIVSLPLINIERKYGEISIIKPNSIQICKYIQ